MSPRAANSSSRVPISLPVNPSACDFLFTLARTCLAARGCHPFVLDCRPQSFTLLRPCRLAVTSPRSRPTRENSTASTYHHHPSLLAALHSTDDNSASGHSAETVHHGLARSTSRSSPMSSPLVSASDVPRMSGKTGSKIVGQKLLYGVSLFLSIGVWLFGFDQ
jgi:hypothetical protein